MDFRDERLELINIEEEMQRDYIDYSMSVIIGRALPDARDGLKPVNRRILYAMLQGGWTHTRPFVKCARVVGEVMGKYHPHGDSAVYDSLVRMAQEFSMRCPLIMSQGNFGSIDGDPPAAYRYTECKLNRLAEDLLADIDKDTVDMRLNFDESLEEPTVLPSRIPNLLANGSTGIAVGMATNIPPHNLNELVDGTVHLIDNPDATVRDLMRFITAPDFPTGATIRGHLEIHKLYETGRGLIRIRGRAEILADAKGKETIIISEIPYTVNKASLVAKIAELVNDKKLEGISDVRDESDKDGIRVVVEIKRNALGSVVLNNLYKHTALENTFGAIHLAIDKGRPKVMNLKELLVCFLDHRFTVITRRTQFELRKAEARAHILEGLLIALDNLDELVRLIRASRNREEAREKIVGRFGFSELQANAILELRLYQITGLERDKVEAEYKEVQERITYLKSLLADPSLIYGVIKEDLLLVKTQYGTPRRTEVVADEGEMNIEDLIEDRPCVITLTHNNYINRVPLDAYREQRRGGRGVQGMATRDEDFVEHMFFVTSHDYLLAFTQTGRMYWKRAYEIPEFGRTSLGKAIVNLINLEPGEKIATILRVRAFSAEESLVFATRNGIVKKTPLAAFKNLRAAGLRAIDIREGDALIGVKIARAGEDVVLATNKGLANRFNEAQLRIMGRTARGVRGIRVDGETSWVVGIVVVDQEAMLMTICEKGYGKRTPFEEYPCKNRGTKGVISIRTSERNGQVVAAFPVREGDSIMVTTVGGQMVRFPVDDTRALGRNTQGVRLMRLSEEERIASATLVANDADVEEEAARPVVVPPSDTPVTALDASLAEEDDELDDLDEDSDDEELDDEADEDGDEDDDA